MTITVPSAAQEYPIFLPNRGPVLDKPKELLNDVVHPYSRNMELYNENIQGRLGVGKLVNTALSGAIVSQPRLKLVNGAGTKFQLFCTPKDIYSLDTANSRFDILTPIYSVGQVKVTQNSAVVRGGLDVDDCDDDGVAWADGTAGADCTPSRVTSSPQEGSAYVRLTVGADATTELLAYHDKAIGDLTAYDSIGFWIRSSVNTNAGDLVFNIDDTAACASPLEAIDIPALTANTWTWVNLTIATPANLTAVASIGITQAVDIGACTIDLDGIVAGDWAGQLGAGDYFKIGSTGINTDATWYEISSVDSDTQITLTAVYAEADADQQTYAARQIFTGDATDWWSWDQFADGSLGDVVIMTNGVDTPVYWPGTGQVVLMTGLPTNFVTAKYVDVVFGRVVFLNCVFGANAKQTIVNSAPADLTSWDDTDTRDLADEPSEITGTAFFNNYHVVFKEDTAYIGRFVGGDEVISYDKASECKGCRSAQSVVEHNNFLAYYGKDKKFHRWNLLQDDIITEMIFPETMNFDPNYDAYVHGHDIARKNQIRWFCPHGDTTQNNYIVVYDYEKLDVKVWDCSHDDALASMGNYFISSDVYADDPTFGALYADETPGYADDSSLLQDSEIFLYGGYDGYVRLCDSGVTDDGNDINYLLRFKRINFRLPQRLKRLRSQIWWLEAAATGSVTIKMRLDNSGSYYGTTKTISLAPDSDEEVVKRSITWDLQAFDFQPEISSTVFFALVGFLNYFYPKGFRRGS